MGLYYFRGENYQILISSASLADALNSFAQGLTDLYGSTLQNWELCSETDIAVYWLEEGEITRSKDLFQIIDLPENTAIWFSNSGLERHSILAQKPKSTARSSNLRLIVNH